MMFLSITASVQAKLIQLLNAFKILMDLYCVDAYRVCATAAFRNASNRLTVVRRIQEALGISVVVIDGVEEALLIHKAIYPFLKREHSYLHVDVGRGSTEVSVYADCARLASRSFDIGAMRILGSRATQNVWSTHVAYRSTTTFYG
jgi:exopolyphosphatase/guanosine-5'-triphosphate,3'-diphosphate pyrophosphatase